MPANILIIENDPQIRNAIRKLLGPKDYVVHVTPNGEIGLEMVEDVNPDLIVLDLILPGMSGLEIIKRLKAHPDRARIPIVVISGIEEKRKRSEEFWRDGLQVDEFIPKADLDSVDLVDRIEKLLRRSALKAKGPDAAPSAPEREVANEEEAIELSPEEVVRQYVTAWNRRDFALEFQCLSSKMTGDLARGEYIMRRRLSAEDPVLANTTQKLAGILSVNRGGGFAAVRIRREETRRQRVIGRQEIYTLERTGEGWKITGVKTART
ncbi:response regulator [Candidatus Sumerlaeota bacterium]|nr:response regulator [Candidatus Sumerlaeota bacterium]